MERTRPPTRLIEPTPLTVSSRSLICLRAISVTSRRSRRPDTAMVMTGIEPVSNLSTIGGSVPSGRSARIVLTLSRTSCMPTSPFFASRNWTVTIETPFGRGRPQLVDARDRIDDVLDRLGDRGLHLLDTGPGQHGRDRANREIHVREQVDTQLAVRKQAQHHRDRHQDPGEDGTIDTDVGYCHDIDID